MSAERGQEPQKRKKKKKKLRNMVSNEAIPVPDWLPCVYVEKRQINQNKSHHPKVIFSLHQQHLVIIPRQQHTM